MSDESQVKAETPIEQEPIPIVGYITELSEPDILNLKETDLRRMIMLKKAAEGVKMLEPPEKPTLHEIPAKDVTVYTVDKLEYVGFLSQKDALAAAEAITKAVAVPGVVQFYAFRDTLESREKYEPDIGVNTKQVYSPELHVKIKSAIAENERMKKEYDEQKKTYDGAQEESAWIEEEVWSRYRQVQRKYAEMDRLFEHFKDYLRLAEGDEDMAWKFLKKAHAIDSDQESYIKSKGWTLAQDVAPSDEAKQ